MADPVRFDGCNTKMTAPAGSEQTVRDMYVFNNGTTTVSCWRLSAQELDQVNSSGGLVWLSVFMGRTTPPTFVGSEDTVRGMIADYGVWKKG
jgi:hypothetical protein